MQERNKRRMKARRRLSPRPASRVPVSPCFLVYLSTCLLMALALGALGVINTWDLPTYALLVAGACVVAGWRARRWLGAGRRRRCWRP